VKESARDVASDARRASAEIASDLKQAAHSAQRAAKEQVSAFAADVGHELNQSAEEQKVRGVEAIQGFARAMSSAAGELEDQSPMVARYVRDAAQQVETLSGNLRGKSVTELMQAASDLARSQPLVFIAGAVASGFALSRFLKSSASRSAGAASAHGTAGEAASQPSGMSGSRSGPSPGGDFNYGRY
jgi:vacuolar-type H+-ATPase subunit E/Vma4